MFTPIAWNNLFYVAIASLIAPALVVSLFSFGIRFFVNAETAKVKASAGEIKALRTEAANRALSYALFALGFGAVIYGVLLIVPGVIPAIK